MNCAHCGSDNPVNAKFCRSCGRELAAAPPASTDVSGDDIDTMALSPREVRQLTHAESLTADTEEAPSPGAPTAEKKTVDPLLERIRSELAADYDIESELGRGGMAIVYKGVEKALGRTVAIKILPPDTATSGDTAERFKREARMAASLDHPNIIPVYRVGQTSSGILYMAMKYVEGKGLDDIFAAQGALPIPVLVSLLTDSASALAYAHDAGIIHRDIKGGNILIDKGGRVLVSDFGIARAAGDHTITATGMVVGTPNYMSPEQCGGMKLGPQADQYSLGILGFQLLTGKLPFEAESVMGLIQHHYMTPPPDVDEARKDIPQALRDIVYRSLAKKPEERYPTTHHMVHALEKVPLSEEDRKSAKHKIRELASGTKIDRVSVQDLPTPETPMNAFTAAARGPAVMTSPPPKKSKAPMFVAAAFIAVLGGGGFYAYQQGLIGGPATPPVEPDSQPPPVATPDPDSVPRLLRFSNLPGGATVTVNGQPHGSGREVLPGEYRYVISAPGYRQLTGEVEVGYADVSVPVSMSRLPQPAPVRNTQPSEPVATGQLFVRAQPSAAVIEVNGQRMQNGTTITVNAGTVRIRVTLAGYQTVDTTVTVPAEGTARVPISLQPAED